MIDLNEHDYIQMYAHSVEVLAKNPDDRELQHQAVLSLARAGSLDFALSEYTRYGLNTVRNHEDIMALGGRLFKDLYLRSIRKNDPVSALSHAQNSAHKYEAAFKDTKGYYSGINAASMALMADMPEQIVLGRVEAILNILPPTEKLTPQDHFFIEATRAECFLLRGNIDAARDSLNAAITFDPLNYTVHAASLKQFKMILKKQGASTDWLNQLSPPQTLHYAGHIALNLSPDNDRELGFSVIDYLQHHDIGFGYGALAAGSDIIIAEALLEEGAELNIILPCPVNVFLETSVTPFGQDWQARFESCLRQASSVKTLSQTADWPNSQLNQFSAKIAMGHAILRSQHFEISAAQLLIWDGKIGQSHTAHHAKDWQETGRAQSIIPIPKRNSPAGKMVSASPDMEFLLQRSDASEIMTYASAYDAASEALNLKDTMEHIRIGLHINIPGTDAKAELALISEQDFPHGILMSETMASFLAYSNIESFGINFASFVKDISGERLRAYALTR